MTTTKAKQGLTKKQELFALEYLKDMNATRAYREVYGASQRVSEVNGSKLLSNTRVKALLDTKTKKRLDKVEKDGQRVIDTLVEIAEKGTQKKPILVPNIKKNKDGTTTVEYTEVFVNDPASANTALANLGKYFKLFIDRHQVDNNISGGLTIQREGK